MVEKDDISTLRKQIESIREKIHREFLVKKSFNDKYLYNLSIELDVLIVKYQKRIRLKSSQSPNVGEEMHGDEWNDVELFPLYQRIVPLTDPQTNFAFEALIRGRTRSGECLMPSTLFDRSEEQQILLDFKARNIAIREARSVIQDTLLFLNCHPRSLQTGYIIEEDLAKLELPIQQLVLEITEQTRIDNLKSLKKVLTVLRKRGFKIALDDFGAGFSNFGLVETLQPEFIKLDRSIIASLETSKQARRVIAGLVAFAEKVKTQLIAEGIEREAQRAILVELGVPYGQGFLLGHPVPLSEMTIL